MRIAILTAVALVTATLFATLAGCSPAGREGSDWKPVPGSISAYWMCHGPTLLYHVDGYPGESFRAVPGDARCKP